jgi:hypothetical protein
VIEAAKEPQQGDTPAVLCSGARDASALAIKIRAAGSRRPARRLPDLDSEDASERALGIKIRAAGSRPLAGSRI